MDVRGDGGYIVCPGSIHPRTGRLYKEETPWTLDLLMHCPVYDPAWLPCDRAIKATPSRSSLPMRKQVKGTGNNERIADVETPVAERQRQARVYLDSVPGTQQGTGADRNCTALTMKLLYGFALPSDSALEMLAEWGQRQDQLDDVGGWYPWTEKELARKIEWCLGQEYGGEVGDKLHATRDLGDMKAISGGSEQTVDRKGLPAMSSVALKVRFTVAVNELPRLSDSSAAMRSRLLIIPFFNTYEGKEDFGLLDRLLTEIPGITNWALAGLRLLRKVGRFQNPSAGDKILRDFVYLSSPIQAFLDECCEVGAEKEAKRNDLQLAWHIWCGDNGHMPGSVADFGKKLRAAIPRVDDQHRRSGGRRDRWYVGLGLTPEAHADNARARNGA